MRLILGLFFLGLCFRATGQQAEPILFQEKIHDFGTIREDGGNADFEFVFTNSSGRTISVLNVQPSCGCTTPGWTKEPIANGKTGSIKASFNPQGRPGFFNKTLTVTTDLSATPIVLQIKGNVLTPAMENDVSRLETVSGALRFKSNSLNLGKVYRNKAVPPTEFKIYHAGEKPVRFLSVVAPPYLKVVMPESIAPNTSATLQFVFDARMKNQYGFVTESVELITDDEGVERKSISVYATIEDYFIPLSEAEKARAPAMTLDTQPLDFKQVKMGASVLREVLIKNTGKQELEVRAIQPNCSCIKVEAKNVSIKPGGETTLAITLTAQGRRGTQNKAVTIYSNDPVNPVQRISLVAVVD